jgi:hypothetical protein
MTITQTVDIPASRRLTIEVPREVPTGATILAFTPATAPQSSRSWRDMQGCCKGQPGSVDEFLADCHADKDRELAREE